MKENKYETLKAKHQKEFDNFPMFFAFSDEQFKRGMEKLGLNENETNKIYSIGSGGFIRKADSKQFGELIENSAKEMQKAIDEDKDGTGFIKDMFFYELGNHEYIITYDLSDTIDALDLTMEKIEKSEKLQNGLKLAKKEYLDGFRKMYER